MNFNAVFPEFIRRCVELKVLLTPVAYLFLIVGMISSTATGRRSAGTTLRTFARTIILIIVLTQFVTWGNQITALTDTTVKEVLKADPTKVYAQYNHALEAKRSATGQANWWEKLFDVGTSIFDSLISAVLWVFGLLVSIIVFYAYLVQKFILYLGYALAPIFIGFLAVRSLHSMGMGYLLGLVGVMIWPLGWGAASLVTAGLLDFMTDQSFLSDQTFGGASGYAFQNFIGVAVIGVWLIFSTIAAPLVIQRAISSGVQVGSALVSGAASATVAALATGATAAGSWSASGGMGAMVRGLTGGAMATGATLIGTSMSGGTYSPTGSLVTAMGQMSGRTDSHRKAKQGSPSTSSSQSTSTIDPSGDNEVHALLRKTKNPHS